MLRSLFVAAIAWSSLTSLRAEEKPDATSQIETALGALTEVQYLDTQLNDVILDLELRHKINIKLDTKHIPVEGKGSETLITQSLRGVTLVACLNAVLLPHDLTWTIHDDILLITTVEAETQYPQTKIYFVGDFASELEPLQNVLTQSVAPESWRNSGGPIGVVVPHDETKTLVVTQTARNQRQVAKLLDALRAVKKQNMQ